MKISYNWLKNFIELHESPEEIAGILTSGGLEVEKVEEFESIRGSLDGLVIGQVITCEKHPGADKLKKTTVDVGNGIILPIVCGAPNVAEGQKVVVAKVGTTVYPLEGEPFKINKAKIRGEISEGMICAEDEIGIGRSHEGIMILNTNSPAGTPFSQEVKVQKDSILEIGLTPNRADAASHLGVARDLKAILNRTLLPENPPVVFDKQDSKISVHILDPEKCPRYCGVVISNVQVKPSPEWLKVRLKSIGIQPINNIVDVTNYILHDIGQPLHAFDFDKIEGKEITIKTAEDKTSFVSLDGIERKLTTTDLVIADSKKPVCLAGIIGGKNSGVDENTKTIFLESAYFSPGAVRKTSLKLGIKTEASYRFERGTDPNMPLLALKKSMALILEVAGGEVASEIVDHYINPVKDFELEIDVHRIHRLIGKPIEISRIKEILTNLNIDIISISSNMWKLKIPSYKVDVQREADIAEEILRIYGYNNIELPDRMMTNFVAEYPEKNKDKIVRVISHLLTPLGFFEIITNSLTKSSYTNLINANESSIKILNSLSEQLDTLRQTLVFSGLEVLTHNLNRQQKNLKLFEFGKTYEMLNGKYIETEKLGLYIVGNIHHEGWQKDIQEQNFFQLKEYFYKILLRLNIDNFKSEKMTGILYETGLKISKGTQEIGSFGIIKRDITQKFDIKQEVFYAELDVATLLKLYSLQLKISELPKFPEVRRDLSLVLNKEVDFEKISEIALRSERKLIKEINVFDVYEGDKIGSGKKSYSVSFVLQDPLQTLTDKSIENTMQKLIQAFEKEIGAVIRK